MEKIYSLLRSNIKSGPFAIDELLQQNLRAGDLIWIEGKSHIWENPGEIPELTERIKVHATSKQKIQKGDPQSASSFRDDIEQRAEELRRHILSHPAPQYLPREVEVVHYDPPGSGDPGPDIEFIDHRKKESPLFEWFSAAAVMLLVVAGVYGGQQYFFGQYATATHATEAVSEEQYEAKAEVMAVPIPVTQPQAALNEPVEDTAVLDQELPPQRVIRKKPPKKALTTIVIASAADPAMASPVTEETIPPLIVEKPVEREIVAAEPETAEPEKKRSLGKVLKGLFKKKKKNDQHDGEESDPEQHDGSPGQKNGS